MPRPYPTARSVVHRFPRPCLARVALIATLTDAGEAWPRPYESGQIRASGSEGGAIIVRT